MLEPTEASMNVSADDDPRPDFLDRIEQFAAADVIDPASVQIEVRSPW